MYLIYSFEHRAWWRASRWGYTDNLAEAGSFTLEDAYEIAMRANVASIEELVVPELYALKHGAPSHPYGE